MSQFWTACSVLFILFYALPTTFVAIRYGTLWYRLKFVACQQKGVKVSTAYGRMDDRVVVKFQDEDSWRYVPDAFKRSVELKKRSDLNLPEPKGEPSAKSLGGWQTD